MAMESMQGYSAGTIQRSVTPQIGRIPADPQNQQTSASDIDITEKSGRAGQQAFQVEITQQARDRLAAAASGSTQDGDQQKAVFSETRPLDQSGAGAGLIINIVA